MAFSTTLPSAFAFLVNSISIECFSHACLFLFASGEKIKKPDFSSEYYYFDTKYQIISLIVFVLSH